MREIKFRVWNITLQRMGKPKSVHEWMETAIFEETRGLKVSENYSNLIFVQYTGLKDKDNKEIYEGDIVKGGISYDWRENETGIVEFGLFESDNSGGEYSSNEICGWNIRAIKLKDEDDIVMGEFIWKKLEIIGNVYENPELLKE